MDLSLRSFLRTHIRHFSKCVSRLSCVGLDLMSVLHQGVVQISLLFRVRRDANSKQ